MNKSTLAVLAALAAQLLALPGAQAFPDRPIKIVVPSPAGGPPDQIARLLSDKMGAVLGQPVIVENRAGGAGGIIGAKSVATSDPDGHTLFMGSTSSVLIAPLLYKNAGYTASTFAPVARVAESTEMLAVHPSVPANTVAELVRLAKEKPGALSYASAGVGTLPHLEGEFLKTAADSKQLHTAHAAGAGLMAAYLAQDGFTGAAEGFGSSTAATTRTGAVSTTLVFCASAKPDGVSGCLASTGAWISLAAMIGAATETLSDCPVSGTTSGTGPTAVAA